MDSASAIKKTMFTKLEQRSWIKTELARGRSIQECLQALREACGYAVLPFHTVVGCVKASREDRDVVQDNLRIERPHVDNNTVELLASLLDYYLFGKVKELLRGTRCNTRENLSVL